MVGMSAPGGGGGGHTTCSLLTTSQKRLIFDNVTYIYHHRIWCVYTISTVSFSP